MKGLSKSRYTLFRKCPKALWLKINKPQEEVIDNSLNERFQEGTIVGDLAKGLLGAYMDVTTLDENQNLDIPAMIKKTQDCLNDGTENICEAAFSFHSESFGMNYCAVDILHKTSEGYEIYEVKSSTWKNKKDSDNKKVLDKYAKDIAYQKWVLTNCGVKVTNCFLVRLEKNYVRDGELDVNALFHITDMKEYVEEEYNLVESSLIDAQSVLSCPSEPGCAIGSHCTHPYDCSFWKYCTKHLPKPSVFDLYNSKSKLKMYDAGKRALSDLADCGLKGIQKYQVEGIEHIDKDGINSFLKKLTFPLYFLDFETMRFSIPPYDGCFPSQQIPFQYSLHILKSENDPSEPDHKEFLAESGKDPRRAIAEQLCKDIPADACVLAYNKSFECGRIEELADFCPDLKNHLLSISGNIKDLLDPFSAGACYLPAMNGSLSIKSVLPALFPNDPSCDYHNLEGDVHNGGEAMNIFPKIQYMEPDEQERARKSLLEYCKLDTLAMVKVWRKLKEFSV